jgi:prolyl-tRNA editing enzyme YbaK/EbsC (Cys-tRNA(Pro) deacylase)
MVLQMRGIPYEEANLKDAGEHRVVKAVVVIADGKPVTLVLPANREVNLGLVRGILGAEEARLANDEETALFFPEWDVPVLMDRSLYAEGDIVILAGTHGDAIRLKFRDWYDMVRPRIAVFAERLEPAPA